MSDTINFTGVEAAKGGNFVDPGVIGLFKVTDMEMVAATDKVKQHMTVIFQGEKEEGMYKERFFISEKALGRFKYFIEELTGNAPDGDLQISRIKDACLGKITGLKIGGTVGDNGKGYSELSYADFMIKPEDIADAKFSVKEQAAITAALAAIASGPKSSTAETEESIDEGPKDLDSEEEV